MYTLVFAFFFLYFLPNNVGIFPLDYIFFLSSPSLIQYNTTIVFPHPSISLSSCPLPLAPRSTLPLFPSQKSRHSPKDESQTRQSNSRLSGGRGWLISLEVKVSLSTEWVSVPLGLLYRETLSRKKKNGRVTKSPCIGTKE